MIKNPCRIRGVVFDLDGLMLDTEPIYRRSWTEAAQAFGFSIPATFYDSLIGIPNVEGERILAAHFGTSFPLADFSVSWRRRLHEIVTTEGIRHKDGLEELLQAITRLKLRTAIATSSSRAEIESLPPACALMRRIDAVTTSDEVEKTKPHPETYLITAEKLSLPPSDILALEDSNNGMRSAVSAGCVAVMVPDLVEAQQDVRQGAHAVVKSLHDVVPMLNRLV